MRILHNARIYTLDSQTPNASAVIIKNGRILALGEYEDLLSSFGEHSTFHAQNMGGKSIIPGLTDAHFHLEKYALNLGKVNCEVPSKAACLQRVAEFSQKIPTGKWVLGHGWNQNDWKDGFGTAAELDAIVPHRPIYLTAKSLHAAWVNKAALQAAGITSQTTDPEDGRIDRDEGGNPTGILFEGAMKLVEENIPEPDIDELSRAILEAQKTLLRMGITGVHDFDGRKCFAALQKLNIQGNLKIRVLKNIPVDDLDHAIRVGLRSGFGNDYLRIGGVKCFADGALGPRTAAMFEPYQTDPDNLGMLLIDQEELIQIGRKAIRNGLNLTVHAIGDRAVHEVLNAFEQLRKFENAHNFNTTADTAFRHRIEHVQIIHPQDISRLAQLGIIASMQPIHATSDMNMAMKNWGSRSETAYAFRSQLENGARLIFGSDAPVEPPNPFWGIYAAITRRREDGSPGPEGWYPEQRLNLLDTLKAFTRGPAFAAGMENKFGRLAPGYMADLIVLDDDPFQSDPEALRDIKPTATMVAGKWVFSSSESNL